MKTPADPSFTATPKTRPRRRWFRFSLRTLLILILLLAAPLAWYVNRAERQRRAVAHVKSIGGYVRYGFDDEVHDFGPKPVDRVKWLRPWLPTDFISSVTYLHVGPIQDLDIVSEFPQLRVLEIWKFNGHDLSPIAKLQRLRRLNVGFDSESIAEVDLAPLSTSRSLEILLISAGSIRDLAPLASLSKLRYLGLDLFGAKDVDLRPLTGLSQLESLRVHSELTEIKSSQALTFPRLNELSLFGGEHFTDISWLGSLTELERLNFRGNLRLSDLTPLAEFKNLRVLDLYHTDVSDLRPLSTMESLERLDISHTSVKDLSPLASLKNLKYLYLWGTAVSDVGVLKGLTSLKNITLRETCVTQDQIDSLQLALPNCQISADE